MVLNAKRNSATMSGDGHPARERHLHRSSAERHSLAVILNLVRTGATTRNEIERKSGLGRAVVAARLALLAENNLIDEGELGPASGGRAPRRVRFNAEAGLVLVAVLDRSAIGVGVSDLAGSLLIEHHEAADLADGPEQILKRLDALFAWILDQHQHDRNLWAIGIAVPGPVEPSDAGGDGWPTLHFLPTWDRFPVVQRMVARHKVPVWVCSNVQMMTLGEARSGGSVGVRDSLFVKFGRGISAGIMSDGRFHRGAQGAAGLIGHISTGIEGDVVCRCGNRDCLEVVAGEDAIVRRALAAAGDGRSRLLAESLAAGGMISAIDVANAAQLGDSFSAELLARSGRMVGTALAALTNAFNPSLIVLSGGIVQADDIFLAAIREAVYRGSHPLVTRDLRIIRSQMGSSAGLVGSALVVIGDLFSGAVLDRWVGSGSPLNTADTAELVAKAEAGIGASIPGPPAPARQPVHGG
jgi:predicted NBD/HSP70 family sugar kinase